MRTHDLRDGQDLWDVITSQTENIVKLTEVVQKQSKDIEVLTSAFHKQQDQIKWIKQSIYDLNDTGKIGLP